jgi:hypothetical protein
MPMLGACSGAMSLKSHTVPGRPRHKRRSYRPQSQSPTKYRRCRDLPVCLCLSL